MRPTAAALLFSLLLLSPPSGQARDLQEVIDSGRIVMLTFPNQESAFSSIDITQGPMPSTGTASHFLGIDVDLMLAFAESLGVELEIRPVSEPSFSALIPDLLAGRGDFIASSFSITPERSKILDFSDPYYSIRAMLVVRKDSGIRNPDDLENKVGTAVAGSSHAARMKRMGIERQRIVLVDFLLETYGQVTDGEADFTIADSSNTEYRLKSYSELEAVYQFPDVESYGIAFPKGSDLRPAVDRFLADAKSSGLLDRILKKYFVGKEEKSAQSRAASPH